MLIRQSARIIYPTFSLKSLLLSYQKKDGPRPSILLLVWHRLLENMITSFFWCDNDKDLKVCFLVTCIICVEHWTATYLEWRCRRNISLGWSERFVSALKWMCCVCVFIHRSPLEWSLGSLILALLVNWNNCIFLGIRKRKEFFKVLVLL